jgi:hypothetical protein
LSFLLTFNKSREWIITTLSYSTNFLSSGVLVLMRRIGGVLLGVHLPLIMGALLMMLLFTCRVNSDVVDGVSDMEGMRVPPHASEVCSPLHIQFFCISSISTSRSDTFVTLWYHLV